LGEIEQRAFSAKGSSLCGDEGVELRGDSILPRGDPVMQYWKPAKGVGLEHANGTKSSSIL